MTEFDYFVITNEVFHSRECFILFYTTAGAIANAIFILLTNNTACLCSRTGCKAISFSKITKRTCLLHFISTCVALETQRQTVLEDKKTHVENVS